MLKLEEVPLLMFQKFQKLCYQIEIQLTLVMACDENTAMTGILCHAVGLKGLNTSKHCSNSTNSSLNQF